VRARLRGFDIEDLRIEDSRIEDSRVAVKGSKAAPPRILPPSNPLTLKPFNPSPFLTL
jgi:hypothetical protein